MCCNPANGRVDFVELLAYKIQLHGTEWIVSLSAKKKDTVLPNEVFWRFKFYFTFTIQNNEYKSTKYCIYLEIQIILVPKTKYFLLMFESHPAEGGIEKVSCKLGSRWNRCVEQKIFWKSFHLYIWKFGRKHLLKQWN